MGIGRGKKLGVELRRERDLKMQMRANVQATQLSKS